MDRQHPRRVAAAGVPAVSAAAAEDGCTREQKEPFHGRFSVRPAARSTRRPSRRSRARAARGRRRGGRAGRGRPTRHPGHGELPTLIPMPSITRVPASARMPATFRPPSSTSFGCLIVAPSPTAAATAAAATSVSSGQANTGGGGIERDRERQPGPGLVVPHAPEPAAALGLVLRESDRAVHGRLRQHLLRRRRDVGVVVLAPVRAAERRQDEFRRQAHVSKVDAYSGATPSPSRHPSNRAETSGPTGRSSTRSCPTPSSCAAPKTETSRPWRRSASVTPRARTRSRCTSSGTPKMPTMRPRTRWRSS